MQQLNTEHSHTARQQHSHNKVRMIHTHTGCCWVVIVFELEFGLLWKCFHCFVVSSLKAKSTGWATIFDSLLCLYTRQTTNPKKRPHTARRFTVLPHLG